MMNRFLLLFLLSSLSLPSLSNEENNVKATVISVESVEGLKSETEPDLKSESGLTSELAQPMQAKPIVTPLKSTTLGSFKNTTLNKPAGISALSNWPVVIMTLLGMILMIFALAWLVRRFSGINFTGGQNMTMLSSLALGAKEKVTLVEVNGVQFLLGVTSQSINHLHTFDAEISGNKAISQDNSISLNTQNDKQIFKGGFAEKLNQLLEKKLKPSNADELEK